MKNMSPRLSSVRKANASGFTLIEILISLALVGLLLVGVNTFIFSMGELWGRNSDVRLFDQHVNAVTRFLSDTFQKATLPPSARANATPIAPVQITPANGIPGYYITFDLPAGCRILNWPDRPLPEVVCSLQVREHEGLYLLWQSRLETTYGTNQPRELLLTSYVSAISYDYFDPTFKRWTNVTQFQNDASGNPVAPQRLQLTFSYGKLTRQTTVVIPLTYQGVPNP
jgi:prepilin-type N-terminal cleavage/methylation domain-containing protein